MYIIIIIILIIIFYFFLFLFCGLWVYLFDTFIIGVYNR